MPNDNQNLFNLVDQGQPQLLESWYPYTSGEIGPYFIQSVAIANNGKALRHLLDSWETLIRSKNIEFDAISAGETRDWAFHSALADRLEKPYVMLYKNGKFINDISRRTFLHVADLNRSGSSFKEYWKPLIESQGGKLPYATFAVDRCEDGKKNLEELGIESFSVINFNDDAWNALHDRGDITQQKRDDLLLYAKNRETWANTVILPEIPRLIELHKDIKSRDKVNKILNEGYPHLKNELVELMAKDGYLI